MKQSLKNAAVALTLLTAVVGTTTASMANTDPPHVGHITGRSVIAGVLSAIIPGIGQAINSDKGAKVATHLIGGFVFPPFRIWSCYDGIVDRKGGYWDGKI